MKSLGITKIAPLVPSILVALIHFTLSIRVGQQANVIFQQQFDKGMEPTGSDAVVAGINRLLSVPIPTLLFAKTPAYGLPLLWWIVTVANSILWGLFIYLAYLFGIWVITLYQKDGKYLETS